MLNATTSHMTHTSVSTLKESIIDSIQDLKEIELLLEDAIKRLQKARKDISKTKRHINPTTYSTLLADIHTLLHSCASQKTIISTWHKQISIKPTDASTLSLVTTIVDTGREFLRSIQTTIGTLITRTDWQSPTFAHSSISQSGRQTGIIYPTINDYKRDQHWDAHHYELLFRKHMIDGFIKFPIQVCTTSSGMAAFTTILNFLVCEHTAIRPVLYGASTYFENKGLILSTFHNNCIEIDDSSNETIIHAIQKYNPSILFLDSLSNTPSVTRVDITPIIKYLMQTISNDTYLIVDNTCLSALFQPFPLFFGKHTKLHLITFESLNKYHEYGMDRVTGGIYWSFSKKTYALFDYRVHLGTNIPDIVAASLPNPNRTLLLQRLQRHERNATYMATQLQTWIWTHPSSPFHSIVYPGLPNHPNVQKTGNTLYNGSFFVIQFNKKYQTIPHYKRFIDAIIKQASKLHVSIGAGTSFGMNTTRIYLTAIRSKPTTPFIRVAVGTEHMMKVELLISVFTKVMQNFA